MYRPFSDTLVAWHRIPILQIDETNGLSGRERHLLVLFLYTCLPHTYKAWSSITMGRFPFLVCDELFNSEETDMPLIISRHAHYTDWGLSA